MIEAKLYTALSPLFSGRVYPDFAPTGTAKPYCTFQQVGGSPVTYMEGAASDKKNARIQINVWGNSRLESMNLIRSIEDLVTGAPLYGVAQTGAIATYDETSALRGAMQDFSFWA